MRVSRKTRVLSVFCVLWMALIFLFSAQDVNRSTQTSNRITRFILSFLEPGQHEEAVTASAPTGDSPESGVSDAASAAASSSAVPTTSTEPEKTVIPERDWFGINRNFIPNILRKIAHFLLYTVLGVLVFQTIASVRGQGLSSVLLSEGFCFLYACTDEFHQYFVEGRGAQFSDVLLDTVGALFGILSVIGVSRLRRHVHSKRD